MIGVINLFPCCYCCFCMSNYPIMFSIFLNGTPFSTRTILCNSASITLFWSCASLMHRVSPSTIQPSTYFITAHWPSPESNFFLDIVSCPLFSDTIGSGNTLWIPCSNALGKRSKCTGSVVCDMCIIFSHNTSSMVQNGFSSNRVKNLFHSFVPHMIECSRPSSYDIVLPMNVCYSSVLTHL